MITRLEFWLAIAILQLFLASNHSHIEEVACSVGADRICDSHFW